MCAESPEIISDIRIVYHNTRSLHLHFENLVYEHNMMAADIIANSESRLNTGD